MSWRGGERQISFLALELRQKGIRQAILCASGSRMATWCQLNEMAHFTYKKRFSLNPMVAWQISQLDQKHSFTHIHTHDSHSHTFAVMAATFFHLNKPLIVHRRVDFPIKNNGLSNWKYNHPSIQAIICVSAFIEHLIRPAIKTKSLLKVIHSGIDLSVQPSGNGIDLRQEFDIPNDHFIIVNLSAIAPHKDYYTFVNTAEILLKNGLPARFLLIGEDGGERADIQRYIQKKGLEGLLVLTGFRKDVPDILAQTDLLLFTSKTEGLGGATMDALKAGVPVVSTHVGGVMEVIEDGVTGLVAPVGDSETLARHVVKMLSDKDLRTLFVKNGLEKVKQFSKEKNAEKIIAVYQGEY